MPSTYSTNLAIELIGTGEQAGLWGNTTNTNLGTLIEQAISGYVTQAVSTGTDTTITIPNGATGVARNMYIELTGTGGASTNLIVPSNKKLYFIFNNTSSGQVTVKVSGQTGVSVPNKAKMILVSNGTDVVNGLNYIADFASNSATITHLSATSATITNLTLTSLVISNLSIASANITNLTATSLTVSSGSTLNGGVVINEPGANADTRIEGDTDANLFFADASTDRIGIGTSSPRAKLDVTGDVYVSGGNQIQITGSAGSTGLQLIGQDSAESLVGTMGSQALAFRTSSTERARITSGGDLLVGTTTQYGTQKFSLNGGIAIDGQNAATPGLSEKSDTDTGIFWPTLNTLGFSTGGTERARITSGGDFGIGTSSPVAKLDVQGILAISNSSFSYWGIDRDNSSGALTFSDSTTQRLELTTSGNLGLGVSPSAWGLGKAIEVGNAGNSIWGVQASDLRLMANAYYDGTNYKYAFSNIASRYDVSNGGTGGHAWYNAASGTAGNNITWTQALTLDASGNLGVGTTSPGALLDVSSGAITAFASPSASFLRNHAAQAYQNFAGTQIYWNTTNGSGESEIVFGNLSTSFLRFIHNNAGSFTERARITSDGNLGVGTTSPVSKFSVINNLAITNASGVQRLLMGNQDSSGASGPAIIASANRKLEFGVGDSWASADGGTFTQAMTLDASGNLGVGTTTPYAKIHATGTIKVATGNAQGILALGEGGGTSVNCGVWRGAANAPTTDGNFLNFGGYDGIVFATGAAVIGSQTERARITSGGNFLVQKTTSNNTDTGINWIPNDYLVVTNNATSSGDRVLMVNRQNSDGTLVEFRQENVNEGTISVSGSTVSYNGGHLSRWSQFSDGSHPDLVKGTVMTNLDQMAVWINPETGEPEENEQLNCMKVSDVEGDPNVAGVFVNWDGESDLNIAMTGDMIIRIAQGVVVQRGDLLMSAGDGTAKPQGDDIRRSKTVAKVTSNHVTCTYEDGSYCVPCVLMAC